MVAARFVDVADRPWPYGDESVTGAGSDERAGRIGLGRGHPDAVPRLGQPRAVDDARLDPGRERRREDVRTMSSPERYVIGIDYGTLSGRALVVRVSDGEELASAVHEYRHGVLERSLDVR